MKATPMTQRPSFSLLKQTDIQAFYHLQMPRWLFTDSRFSSLPLEAKVAYTFLLNRFQLSKLNDWINDNGEVFIIFTREALASEMQVSYRKVIDCMKTLAEVKLIYERRCGRGDANQIYLAKVDGLEDYTSGGSAPFIDEESRSAETALLESAEEAAVADDNADLRPAESALLDLRESHTKTCENSTSATAYSAHQDLQNTHTSNTNSSKTKKSYTDPSVTLERDAQTDVEIAELDEILAGCDLWVFSDATAHVFENAIERLFFTEQYRIGNAVLPRKKVRAHLHQLDALKLKDAENKISANTQRKIRNSTAYTMAVIFNTIWECDSDVMCDPYLNELRKPPCT